MKTPTPWLRKELDLDAFTRKGIEDHPLFPTLEDAYYDDDMTPEQYLDHVRRMIDDLHMATTIVKKDDDGNIVSVDIVELTGGFECESQQV